jgi:Cft2 family RNA processing exonuclease
MLRLENGISYGNASKSILFDPPRKADKGVVCVSHAHSDHARAHKTRTLMTPETSSITGIPAELVEYGKSVEHDEYEITPFPAGHVFGSAQFRVCDGSTMVYTGDFKLQDSLLFKGAQPIHCDDLVIESTFGLPDYSFPEREQVYADIASWVKDNHSQGRTVLLGGYAVGKAQELTRLVNEYCSLTPLVHPAIKQVNDACVRGGLKLGQYFEFNSPEGREISRDAFVALIPPSMVSLAAVEAMQLQSRREVAFAVATGWAGVFSKIKAFPLSDHADYKQLVEYVKQAAPKRVYTVHGFASEFARQLKREGFDARPLEKDSQERLDSFF